MTVFVAPVAEASINPPFNNEVISKIPWRLQNKSSPLSFCGSVVWLNVSDFSI